ncbi:MAG: metal-dependent hydrolase [Patescibacteria group bacterium]|nr:metal-dependent hydrolase [Patescibacteria group bacterium]MDE2015208.1 metal-dependent hydrolase [Patescibacteria group bacterium]MDE2226635.1 metal-dependent hydrolase [Patescibacteria group bacterium]
MLVLLPTHGCLANLFSRFLKNKWSGNDHLLLVIGAIVPDMPVIMVGTYELIKYLSGHPQALQIHWITKSLLELLYDNERPKLVNYLYTSVGYYRGAIFLRDCLHSVFFWIILIVVACLFKKIRRKFLIVGCGAIFFHIFLDWPTHITTAYNYFWPFTLYPVRGFISHDNPWLLRAEMGIWFICLVLAIRWTFVKIGLCKKNTTEIKNRP